MASVTYEHVYKRFGDVIAVNDLNIKIADKEFLVFVGPSGCGKTTSLRLLAGLEEITDGRILIGDRVVNDVPPKDRDIAMVFQSYALYPHMSVYDNMAFGLKLRKTPKAEIDQRVKEAAEILGISQFLDRKPKQLSGGQRQRVAVGRAIVRDPAVFLFDEPLSNLDAKLRVQTRAEHQQAAPAPGHHLHLRDPRPGGGHDHGDPHRRDEGRHAAADRHAAEPVRSSGQHLRRRLHRQPVDELLRRDPGRAGRQAVRRRRHVQAAGAGDQEGRLSAAQGQEGHLRHPARGHPCQGRIAAPGITPAPMTAQVDVTELMGNEIFLYLLTGKKQFIARVDPRTHARVGETIDMIVNMDNMHLFDPQTEKTLDVIR